MGSLYTLPLMASAFVSIDSNLSDLTQDEITFKNYFVSNALHVYSNPNDIRFNVLREYYAMSESTGVSVAYYNYDSEQLGYFVSKDSVMYTLAIYYGGSIGEEANPHVRVQSFSLNRLGLTSYRVWADVYNETGFAIVDVYDNIDSAYNAIAKKPITYRLTNCTAPNAPTKASAGSTVTVPLSFPSGYGVNNPSTDAYVTNNGVVVPSNYSNGVLTFTMP